MTSFASRKNFRSKDATAEPNSEKLATFLRQSHPWDTAGQVEKHTGISAGTVEKWLQEAAFPRVRHLFRLLTVYGPELLVEIWPGAPSWLSEAVRADELARMKDAQAKAMARIAELEGR